MNTAQEAVKEQAGLSQSHLFMTNFGHLITSDPISGAERKARTFQLLAGEAGLASATQDSVSSFSPFPQKLPEALGPEPSKLKASPLHCRRGHISSSLLCT